jgi:hypothetical protein
MEKMKKIKANSPAKFGYVFDNQKKPTQMILSPLENNIGEIIYKPTPKSSTKKIVPSVSVKKEVAVAKKEEPVFETKTSGHTYEDSLRTYNNYLKRKEAFDNVKPDTFKSVKELNDYTKKMFKTYPTDYNLALKTESPKKKVTFSNGNSTTIFIDEYKKPTGSKQAKVTKPEQSKYPKGYQPYRLYGRILDPEVYGYGQSINNTPIEVAQFADTYELKKKMQDYTKNNSQPWLKKSGGVVAELTPEEIQEYINQGYIVEDVDDFKIQSGAQLPYQVWEEKTGTSWAEAKKQGLTDGSAEQNIALMNKLLRGASPSVSKPQTAQIQPAFDYSAYDNNVKQMVNNGATLEDLVHSRMGTREGLMNRFPDLFSASNAQSKVINKVNIPQNKTTVATKVNKIVNKPDTHTVAKTILPKLSAIPETTFTRIPAPKLTAPIVDTPIVNTFANLFDEVDPDPVQSEHAEEFTEEEEIQKKLKERKLILTLKVIVFLTYIELNNTIIK